MANYDDIVEQNKKYLTRAQIKALVDASQRYTLLNAKNRAEAQASVRQQYDAGYRGLQNLGLAGASGAAPTSGEVPRLGAQVQAPFDQYNQSLKNVEHQRLAALGNAYAQQTKAARAAEAAKAAQTKAAVEALKQQKASEIQRAQAVARAISMKTLPSAPKVTAKDLVLPSEKEFPPSKTDLYRASIRQQQALMEERQNEIQRAQAVARAIGMKTPTSAPGLSGSDLSTPSVKEFPEQKATAEPTTVEQKAPYVSQPKVKMPGLPDQQQYEAQQYEIKQEADRLTKTIMGEQAPEEKPAETPSTRQRVTLDLKKALEKYDAADRRKQKFADTKSRATYYDTQMSEAVKELADQGYTVETARQALEQGAPSATRTGSKRAATAKAGRSVLNEVSLKEGEATSAKTRAREHDPAYIEYKQARDAYQEEVRKQEESDRRIKQEYDTQTGLQKQLSELLNEYDNATYDRDRVEQHQGTGHEAEEYQTQKRDEAEAEIKKAGYSIDGARKLVGSIETLEKLVKDYDHADARLQPGLGTGEEWNAKYEKDKRTAVDKLEAMGYSVEEAHKTVEQAGRFTELLKAYDDANEELGKIEQDEDNPYDHHSKRIQDAVDAMEKLGYSVDEARQFVEQNITRPEYGEPEAVAEARGKLYWAQMKYENHELYASAELLYNYDQYSQYVTPETHAKAAKMWSEYQAQEMGFKNPTMTDEEYEENKKIFKDTFEDAEPILRMIDHAEELMQDESTTADGEELMKRADKEAQKLGFKNAAEIRQFQQKMNLEQDARAEYQYFQPALEAMYLHMGEKPTGEINAQEQDATYRRVNGQQAASDEVWAAMTGAEGFGEYVENYMTPEQRDAYNAIYERDGLQAANKYIEAIKPILNIQRAQQDEAYYREFADEHPTIGSIRSIGANLLYNVPAFAEQMGTGIINLFRDEPRYYDVNSNLSFRSGRAEYLRSERVQNILSNQERPEWMNNIMAFAYNNAMSIFDSAAAMGVAMLGVPGAADILFASSAGTSAYKDAKARGATQGQAMLYSGLNAFAEAFFEHVSLERHIDQFVNNRAWLRDSFLAVLNASGISEGSEELATGIADAIIDISVMGDKSEYSQKKKEYLSKGDTQNLASWHALRDLGKDTLLEGLGGYISGGVFTISGAGANAISTKRAGHRLRIDTDQMTRYEDVARLLGGEAQEQLAKYEKKPTDTMAGRMKAFIDDAVQQLYQDDTPRAYEAKEAEQTGDRSQSVDKAAAITAILSGDEMNAAVGDSVLEVLGKEKLSKMGYDISSGEKFAASYNARLQRYDIQSRTAALQETIQKIKDAITSIPDPVDPQKSAEAVWKDPNLGFTVTEDGKRIQNLPGNLTSVSYEEQQKSNFAARTTAKVGNVTYAISGMEARAGLDNGQTLAEIKKNLSKEHLAKAQFFEKLSKGLPGVGIVIHDTMGPHINASFDARTDAIHVSLDSPQSVLRVLSHELTHMIKKEAFGAFNELQKAIIDEIGQERFDRMARQKAEIYTEMGDPIDYNTKEGRAKAEEETVAELCEQMLSRTDWLEQFCEEHTEAARTLKDYILKIVNAIKDALKDVNNQRYGASASDMIQAQRTFDKWAAALDAALENVGKNADVDSQGDVDVDANAELYTDESTVRAQRQLEDLRKEAEAEMQKGPYPRGYSSKAVDGVIEQVIRVLGDRDSFSAEDYERLRARIGQSLPVMEAYLMDRENETKEQAALDRVRQVANEIVDAYRETEGSVGDLKELRADIPDVIGVGPNQAGDIRSQYDKNGIFNVGRMISSALGKRVTLVTKSNPKFAGAMKMDEVFSSMQEKYNLSDEQDFSRDAQNLVDFIQGVRDASEGTTAQISDYGEEAREQAFLDVQTALTDALMNAAGQKAGVAYSLDTDWKMNDKQSHVNMGDVSPVEETRELVAVHNLTGEALEKSLKRGGFPMPSIAVLKQSQGHNRYGDVSVIFGKETIDPQAFRSNKVYGGDAWTPVYPTIEYKPNAKVEDRISKKYYELSRRIGYDKTRPMYNYVTDMERQLNNSKGEAAMLQKLYDDTGMMQVYLDDVGLGRVEDIYSETRTEMSKEDRAFYTGFIKELGKDTVTGYNPPEDLSAQGRIQHRRKFLSDHRQEIIAAYENLLRGQFGFDQKEIENAAMGLDNRQLVKYLNDMNHLIQDNGVTVKKEYDADATNKAIMDKVDQKEYRAWIDGLFKGIEEKSGIRNNADYWTRSGNRRSFEALHYEDTLENVVKVMREQNQTGNTAIFAGNAIWGVAAKDYKSISEIKQDSSRLKTMTENEYKQIKEGRGERFQKIAQSIADKKADNAFIALDNAMENIVEAVRTQNTKDGMLRFLQKYHDNVTMKTVDQIVDLVRDIANMPTEYFEAKPMRAVGADEIKTVILPEGKYPELEADLSGRGIPVVTYEYENETDRLRALQSAEVSQYSFSLDTDALQQQAQVFTQINDAALKAGLEQLKNVTPGSGIWALQDVSRFFDKISGGDKEVRDTLTQIFENPHRQSLKNYAEGVKRMQQRVLDIGARAGVCDEKGKHFDKKKSAAIQNIGEGFSNTYTDLKVRIKDADAVTVKAYEPGTDKLVVSERDYTLRELRGAYGRDVADAVWTKVFDEAQKAKETGKQFTELEYGVNTRPYILENLQNDFRDDWQKLYQAAGEFRKMYDEYIRTMNQMLEEIYPNASKYADVDKITKDIEKKEAKLKARQDAESKRIAELNKKIGEKEAEMAGKRRKDTKAFRQLHEQAESLRRQVQEAEADLREYEANVRDELLVMSETKALLQNSEREGDSLSRMHRLEYREDYFHHFQEMASGVQNLKAIFTGNTDISPAVVGKSANTKPKSRFAGFFQKRTGADYTADALNGMLRYGQLAEYKLAFDPFAAYLRNATEEIQKLDKNETNRNNLIRYIKQWTNAILGKSHDIDRAIVDSGVGMRSKVFKVLDWINSRVIQNTLLWNMRSALIQISNITNAKSIVTNNLDWANGIRSWALAARGNEEMQAIMAQSTFLASRYMDDLQFNDSFLMSAKQFAGWMLGALDEISAKATWWAAYTQYQRNPNAKVIKNASRTYANAIEYADDVTRRTHAGRGVGELAPAMTSRVINFVAPFQVEVNNTWQLLKDNVKQRNYLGLLSTGLSVFLFNAVFETIVGSTPLGFDFIRAIVDICFGIAGDDPDDYGDDYGVKDIWQRLSGEFVGGLPYASQIVSIFGEDFAKEILGEDNDATRYGNTQIGVQAIVNAYKGVKDATQAAIHGRQTNWIADIDDLLNIIMPMGAKQLTRTAEGLLTVAKGYGGKVSKGGQDQVQFVTDQDLIHYLHAGLFGKWALTEASEYFDEERLIPKIFGAYEGPSSSFGKLVDADEYKAAVATGISGKEYFTLKSDMRWYSTQAGKRAEMLERSYTPEQKAQLDALMIPSSLAEVKTSGAIVYQKNSKDEWEVKADYTDKTWFEVSMLGSSQYEDAKGGVKAGLKPETYLTVYAKWKTIDAKDENGNTVNGLKKKRAQEYLDSLHLSASVYDYIWTVIFGYKK